MPQKLKPQVRLFRNPWRHTVPTAQLFKIFSDIADARLAHIIKQHEAGNYEQLRLGMAFLNPAAARSMDTNKTLLATIAIGADGPRLVINAIAKAAYHRDHGQPAGFGVYTDLTQSADGDFCFGYSAKVDGQIAAASGQSEEQDACEAGHAAVSLIYFVRVARKSWLTAHPNAHWFGNQDQPNEGYLEMLRRRPLRATRMP